MNIFRGLVACHGVVKGKAVVMTGDDDKSKMQAGSVLVLKRSDPSYAECVMQASALICETGGRLTHICVVALEMGIPCIVQVSNATSLIHDGDSIFIDTYKNEIIKDEG